MRLPGVPDDIVGLIGPLAMGYLFAYLLQGVLIVQVFIFCSQPRYASDRWPIKLAVWCVFFLENIATIFGTVSAWYGLVKGWGDPNTLLHPSWGFSMTPAIHGMISLSVQLFFCWRMWLLGAGALLPCLIAVVSFMQSTMAIVTTVKVFGLPDLTFVYRIIPFVSAWLSGSVFCDIMIAFNLVMRLYKAGRRSELKSTNSLLMRPILICAETGIVTACSSIIHLTTYLACRTENTHFTFLFITSKLYSNTLLASLNARRQPSDVVRVVQTRSSSSHHKARSSRWQAELNSFTPSHFNHEHPPTAVYISTSTTTHKDEDAEAHMPNGYEKDACDDLTRVTIG
ncbi:hypothetical protein OE88DRAFT_1735928 [Heliocybe sulcata]|uniref:DUF6534 domain-containing protein n=1 Tax=Heliocybe sulcata TaxID=5364 RepID=A0A5C3N958_9AGAM|nr:hypothetical protein OE88DRAFT_1735928 [Heliocybe sulcata]